MDSLRIDIKPAPVSNPIKAASYMPAAQQSVPEVQDSGAEQEQVESKDFDNARAEMVVKAAHTISNYFVVSDVKFTIFKNNAGSYVTKFTNLRDGSVTYYPEQEVLKMYTKLSGQSVSLLATQA